jgi:nucleotide-binding universal stress UspA family protein
MSTPNGTLLVPVANPETVDRLLDTAVDLARGRSMRVVVVHVVEVPPQVPLSEGGSLLRGDGQRRLLADAVAQLEAADVPAGSRLRYARDVATGLVGAVETNDADALLMGWRGRPRRRDVVLGSFLDRVLGEAACDVFVKRIRTTTGDLDSVLVPVAGGPHGSLAAEFAGTVAGQHDATVHLLHVLPPSAPETTREQARALLSESAALLTDEVAVETAVHESDHVAGAITDATAAHDLTVLGATRGRFLRRRLVGAVAEGVGRAAASPVVLARRAPDRGEEP